jgi:hypothetical protein
VRQLLLAVFNTPFVKWSSGMFGVTVVTGTVDVVDVVDVVEVDVVVEVVDVLEVVDVVVVVVVFEVVLVVDFEVIDAVLDVVLEGQFISLLQPITRTEINNKPNAIIKPFFISPSPLNFSPLSIKFNIIWRKLQEKLRLIVRKSLVYYCIKSSKC